MESINNDGCEQYFLKMQNEALLPDFEIDILNAMKDRQAFSEKFSDVTYASLTDNNDTPYEPMRNHVMINNYESEMGTHWGIAAVHKFETEVQSVADSSWSFLVGDLSNLPVHKKVLLDKDSAAYYDSNIKFEYSDTMNGEAISGALADNEDNLGNRKIAFDLTDNNYNAFKAVNSRISRVDEFGNMRDHGIRYADDVLFNGTASLLSNKKIEIDPDSHQLYQVATPYQTTDKLNISVVETSNENVKFGILKLVQDDIIVDVTYNPVVSSMTMKDMTDVDLPTEISTSQFNELFTPSDLAKVGPGYTLTVTSDKASSGAYALEETFRGFDINDDNIARNIVYMSTLDDFSNVSHSIEVSNGNFVVGDGIWNEKNLGLFSIVDSDETLNSSQYNTDGSITFNVKNRNQRAINTLPPNDPSMSVMRITYPGELVVPQLAGEISNDRLTTYDLCYNWLALVPSTDVCSNYLNAHSLKSEDTIVVIPENSASLFNINDVVFDMNKNMLPNPNKLNLIKVKQQYLMTNEEGSDLYYYDQNNGVVTYTHNGEKANIEIVGQNVDLSKMLASDVGIRIQPKTISDITVNWTSAANAPTIFAKNDNSNDTTLHTSKNSSYSLTSNNGNIFNMLENPNGEFNFVVSIVQPKKAQILEELDNISYKLTYTDTNTSSITGNVTNYLDKVSNDFKMNVVSTVEKTLTFDSLSGLPSNNVLKLKIVKQVINFEFNTFLSSYTNLFMRTKNIVLVKFLYHLEDLNGRRLPDAKMKAFAKLYSSGSNGTLAINLSDLGLITSGTTTTINTSKINCRSIMYYPSTNYTSTSFATAYNSETDNTLSHTNKMKTSDLSTFYASVNIKGESGNWENQPNTKTSIDLCYDTPCVINYKYNPDLPEAVLTVNIDLPDGSDIGNEFDYFIELSNQSGNSTFSVTGYEYGLNDVSLFENWEPLTDDSDIFFPNQMIVDPVTGESVKVYSGTKLNLTTKIIRTDPNSNDPSDQNHITLQILNGMDVIAEFFSNINIASNFNIIHNQTPILKVEERLGEQINTYYVSEQTEQSSTYRYIKVIDGVEIGLLQDITDGQMEKYYVPGDNIMCSLYSGYDGNYSTTSEINPINTLDIGDLICRHLNLSAYRGVVYTEIIPLIRTVSTIDFVVTKDANIYRQVLGDLYDGSSHVVDNINVLGNLGLNVAGNYSRFVSSTVMVRPIIVTHGLYIVDVNNPLDESLNQNYTVSTSMYEIKLYETLKIVSSRVKVYSDELYSIKYTVPDVKVYLTEMNNVEGVDASTYSSWSPLLEEFSDAMLRDGVIINGNSQLSLMRTLINVQQFTEYYSLSRPQFKLEAISRNDVQNISYTSNPDRKVYYSAITFESNHQPFVGVNGLNDVKLTYLVEESYTVKRLLPGTEIYDYFNIKSNTIKIVMNFGYYDSINVEHQIYDGQVNLMSNILNDNFEAIYNDLEGNVDFKFKQPMNLVINSLSANSFTDKNILVNDIHNFGSGNGYINLHTGDSIMFKLYGLNFELASDGSSFKCIFVKYETNYGLDYFNENLIDGHPEQGHTIKNIKFYATERFTHEMIVNTPTVLTSTPYNLKNMLENNILNNINWQLDGEFIPANLKINVVSVSTIGLDYVQKWLAVNKFTPCNILLLETPDLMEYKSLDGSQIIKITNSGCVVCPILKTYEVNLSSSVDYPYTLDHDDDAVEDFDASQQIPTELFAYNIMGIGGI
jgi:hypothetical protein